MKILVTGGRNFTDRRLIEQVFGHLNETVGPCLMCHGGARGLDIMADEVARSLGWEVQAYFADWEREGKSAGFIRNQRMLDDFKPELGIVFPGGRGTADMERRLKKAGVTTVEASFYCKQKPGFLDNCF